MVGLKMFLKEWQENLRYSFENSDGDASIEDFEIYIGGKHTYECK